ncbi:MAG: alpha/beta hydrolase [Pseudomonadota bacterium]
MTWTPLALKLFVICALLILLIVAIVQWRAGVREAAVEADYPPSGQFVDALGTKIHLKVTGQGPDVVLIHGASGSMRDFTFALVDALSSDYRVIAVDRPGMGWSDRPEGFGGVWNTAPEPPRLQAQILQAATDQIGVHNPIVVGHSFGGTIALAWALERPDDTAGLVLLGAASNPWKGKLGLLYQVNSTALGSALVIPVLTAFTPHFYVEKVLGEIFSPQHAPQGYMKHFGADMTLRRGTMRANAQQVNALKPFIREMAKHYASLDLPVEILHGTADFIVPLSVHSEPLSTQLPHARLQVMPGVGHMPHHVAPEDLRAAIDRVAAQADLR